MAVYETLAVADPYRAQEIASTIAGFQITDHPAVKPGESKTLAELFGQRGFTYKGLIGKAIGHRTKSLRKTRLLNLTSVKS